MLTHAHTHAHVLTRRHSSAGPAPTTRPSLPLFYQTRSGRCRRTALPRGFPPAAVAARAQGRPPAGWARRPGGAGGGGWRGLAHLSQRDLHRLLVGEHVQDGGHILRFWKRRRFRCEDGPSRGEAVPTPETRSPRPFLLTRGPGSWSWGRPFPALHHLLLGAWGGPPWEQEGGRGGFAQSPSDGEVGAAAREERAPQPAFGVHFKQKGRGQDSRGFCVEMSKQQDVC